MVACLSVINWQKIDDQKQSMYMCISIRDYILENSSKSPIKSSIYVFYCIAINAYMYFESIYELCTFSDLSSKFYVILCIT